MARFDKTTGQWYVKVIDFGLAVKVQAARVSVSVPSGQRAALDRSLAGTLRYAPPEQRNELDAALGPYSDVYAFGKTCLDLLFGTTEPKSFDWAEDPGGVSQAGARPPGTGDGRYSETTVAELRAGPGRTGGVAWVRHGRSPPRSRRRTRPSRDRSSPSTSPVASTNTLPARS